MNNTFSPQRFGLLFKKTLLERPIQMFGFTGLLLALILITYAITKTISGFTMAQNLTFLWGLIGGSYFMASFVFSHFTSNAIGSSYLTLPASHLEKWLCGILIAAVLYPTVFMLFYRLMDASFVSIYHNSLDPAAPFYKEQYRSVGTLSFNGFFAWKVYPMFLFAVSAMLTGSLYFNKAGLIKVSLVICGLLISLYLLNHLFAKIVFGGVIEDAWPFHYVMIPVGKAEGSILLPEKISDFAFNMVSYVFPAILFITSFIRLREKEF
ncbi:MAG: hypothetical protein JWR61_3248 [Ferruginibacter sp.]|uniref:hypothetical protein n=1 Tax=Ferruginibacter sp. TaxID=1940288 RepID=UPI00265800EB|nr:hypothetical protein [Ferruginibacter sp.]MDB5278293.1 hypothetical protein [Ferruginibacter sp.]